MDYTLTVIILAMLFIILAYLFGRATGKRFMFDVMSEVLKKEQEDRKKSQDKSRAVLKGQISEQFAPFNIDFPVNSSECSFLGKPIDFIAFKGLDNRVIEEIIFIEVKTGKSKLSSMQKSLKEAIENKKVRFETVRIE